MSLCIANPEIVSRGAVALLGMREASPGPRSVTMSTNVAGPKRVAGGIREARNTKAILLVCGEALSCRTKRHHTKYVNSYRNPVEHVASWKLCACGKLQASYVHVAS